MLAHTVMPILLKPPIPDYSADVHPEPVQHKRRCIPASMRFSIFPTVFSGAFSSVCQMAAAISKSHQLFSAGWKWLRRPRPPPKMVVKKKTKQCWPISGLGTVQVSHNSTQQIIFSLLNYYYYVSQGPEVDPLRLGAGRHWTSAYSCFIDILSLHFLLIYNNLNFHKHIYTIKFIATHSTDSSSLLLTDLSSSKKKTSIMLFAL